MPLNQFGVFLSKLTIYTDGAARGNPGPSASGYKVYEGSMAVAELEVYNGLQTNNFAEYNAVIMALEWCAAIYKPKETEVHLYSDSELVIRQLGGKYKVKAKHLLPMNLKARVLLMKFKSYTLNSIPREHHGISEVDARLNRLLDKIELKQEK